MAIEDFEFTKPYTRSASGLISTSGDVRLIKKCKRLSEKFYKIGGDFSSAGFGGFTPLESLDGLPDKISNVFSYENKLTTLVGSPSKIIHKFSVGNNCLTTLIGGPWDVSDYYCHTNFLTDLKGSPNHLNFFNFSKNPLTSLEGFPESVNEIILSYDVNLPLLQILRAKSIEFEFGRKPRHKAIIEIFNDKNLGYTKKNVLDTVVALVKAGLSGNARF